ncbi:MAG: uracil-DNA glycosylase family protein [Myxococcota bacterium]
MEADALLELIQDVQNWVAHHEHLGYDELPVNRPRELLWRAGAELNLPKAPPSAGGAAPMGASSGFNAPARPAFTRPGSGEAPTSAPPRAAETSSAEPSSGGKLGPGAGFLASFNLGALSAKPVLEPPSEPPVTPVAAETSPDERRSEPSRTYDERRSEPSRAYDERRFEPSRAYDERRSEPSRTYDERRSEPSRIYDERRGEPSRAYDDRRGEPSRAYDERQSEPPRRNAEPFRLSEEPARSDPARRAPEPARRVQEPTRVEQAAASFQQPEAPPEDPNQFGLFAGVARVRPKDVEQFDQPLSTPGVSDKVAAMRRLQDNVGECMRCNLSDTRSRLIYGVGNLNSSVMFISDAPGSEEERTGEPLAGEAGVLFDRILETMLKCKRTDIYLANLVLCSPGSERSVGEPHFRACQSILDRVIEVVRPALIVPLGPLATRGMFKRCESMARMRGHFFLYRGIDLLPTFHPRTLLQEPGHKRSVKEDMEQVAAFLAKRARR